MKIKEEVSMITVADKVYDKALSLPANDRIGLVERLLSSLTLPTQPDVDKLWADEAERRVAQIDSGEAELIPGETVFARIRKRYRR